MILKIGRSLVRYFNILIGKMDIFVTSDTHRFTPYGKLFDYNFTFDAVRASTLELVCQEIKRNRVEGETAELGVYRGDFAKYINAAFPEKKLYLFDTFEGFEKTEMKKGRSSGDAAVIDDFSKTSANLVLSKMRHSGQCIIKKGFFPDTAKDVEAKFALVSIDADLYEPILAGLDFFYGRLSKGGYILIHDYNNKQYKGANKAVVEFCTARGITLVPVADASGSAIIIK
ncbi:O-methyltransferase [Ereboglobus sp. PH5-10]|uniref:TylF/MycF/NovP-related O-methyltransferase n=1 Tax=Ereboglobus sp. PH5-10 TaxID=2940629 RepID=UPI002404B571|nr:TylF/MycF/NovP-related O-methyltransferase [Ereboglobus sp. PH5-10]MDF9828429.1 O-methyltransferase [Ereboglobus sp. PH5-10]